MGTKREALFNFMRLCELADITPDTIDTAGAVLLLQERARTNGYATFRELAAADHVNRDNLGLAQCYDAALACIEGIVVRVEIDGSRRFCWMGGVP